MKRRAAIGRLLGGVGVLLGLAGASIPAVSAAKRSSKERVIKIIAQKFHYTPNEFTVKKGETTVLEFTALDFVHGFKVPDLNIRVDLPPGQLTRVRITPDKAGVLDFLCDNFCGSGHEEMNGRIIVTE
jgi:cytochrome c oxidase subunit 2